MNPRPGEQQFTVSDPGERFDCKPFCESHVGTSASDLPCSVSLTSSGDDGGTAAQVTCPTVSFGCGRRAEGVLAPRAVVADDEVGDYLARAAHLEATSVVAFDRLARELEHHDAPPALIDGARRAALEERRHARIVGALARARGAAVPALELLPFQVRPLVALATENAIEGVVGETFGAALALHQGAHAEDRKLAQAMTRIARDELGHAELAWAIDAWVRRRLPEASGTLDRARRRAAARVPATARLSLHARRRLGLPGEATRRLLLRRLRAELWR